MRIGMGMGLGRRRRPLAAGAGGGGGGNNAPVVDLNGAGGGINASGTFTEGDAFTSYLSSATLTDADSDPLVSLIMTCGGADWGTDGLDEQIKFDTWVTDSATDFTGTLVVGSTTFSLAFVSATGILTVTKSGGGTFPAADGQALIRLQQYGNGAEPPTEGNRTFTWVASDGTDSSTAAVLTVTVAAIGSTVLSLGGTGGNYAGRFVVGGTAAAVSDNAGVAGDDPIEMVITLAGFADGNDETVTIGATAYPAATDDTGSATAGATTFDVDFTSGVFTVTKNGGGAMPAADLQTLIDGIETDRAEWPYTPGARTLTFQLDGGTAKVATITTYIAEPPRLYVDTTYSLPTGGTTFTPADAAALQTAFDTAVGGDVIVLTAGVTYQGNFTLSDHGASSDDIYIISSELASLPVAGTRVSPDNASDMPKLIAPDAAFPALIIEQGVQGVRLVGIEISTAFVDTNTAQYGLVRVGIGGVSSDPADRIILDRCYIHGTATGNIRDGILTYNTTNFGLIDSHVSDIHALGDESHGIQVYNSPGPCRIANNFIEAAGINVFLGDNGSLSPPEDVEIVDNTIAKPWSWNVSHPEYAGTPWSVKNLLEVKAGRRLLIAGNLLEKVWIHAQHGQGFVITPRGGVIEDLNITRNIIRSFAGGINLSSADVELRRVEVSNNLFYNVGSPVSTTILVTIAGTPTKYEHLAIVHNTFIAPDATAWISFYGSHENEVDYVTIRDNLTSHGIYGIAGNSVGIGFVPVDYYTEDYDVQYNAMIGGSSGSYIVAPGFGPHLFPVDVPAVGFTDSLLYNIDDFKLAPGSPYKDAASDGTDIGADIDLLPSASPVNNAPIILLDGATTNESGTFTEGDSATAFVGAATVTDTDSDPLATLTIVGSGITDGVSEVLVIGGTSYPLNADKTATGTAGSTTFDIVYVTATQTFTIDNNAGGTMPLADLQTLVRGITYANSETPPTEGDRTFTFVVNDGIDDSVAATLTVAVAALDVAEDIDDHTRKHALVIQNGKIDADLADYSVYITRDMLDDEVVDPSGGNAAQVDGGDLRFSTDSAGTTLIPCDVIAFEHDTTTAAGDATILIAVKVPSVLSASDTTIYVWYAASVGKSQPDPSHPIGSDNAYDDDFLGFYPSAGTTDRTVNSLDMTANGSPTIGGATGPLGLPATDFNGSSQYMVRTTSVPTAYPITMICWGEPDNATAEHTAMCLGLSSALNIRASMRFAGATPGDPVRVLEYHGVQENADSSAGYTANTWYHAAAVVTSTTDKAAFLNGANKGTLGTSAGASANPNRFAIGAQVSSTVSNYFDGAMALVELHTAARSDAWIKANREMIADPAAFAVAGTPSAA